MKIETDELEAMKQIIREATIELMDCGGTTPKATCEVVAEYHPALYAAVGADRVLTLCWEIEHSSDPTESAWLREIFATFNTKYFNGQLGDFTVLGVYYAGEKLKLPRKGPRSGWVDFLNRQIHIRLTPHRNAMSEMLLHHMAYAAVVNDDAIEKAWFNEMLRLRELGAPTESGI